MKEFHVIYQSKFFGVRCKNFKYLKNANDFRKNISTRYMILLHNRHIIKHRLEL